MNWVLVTVCVCSYGFFKELRPSEAYLSAYLLGPWKNLTVEQVDNEIYPWWTYSYLIWLVPVFLLTDFLRYKPVLILNGASYICTWTLLLWTNGVPAMRAVEVLYGFATAGEIAYFSYLYAIVHKNHFKKVASFTRGSLLIGRFVAYVIAQLMTSFELLDYFQLHVFSFVSVCVAFGITVFLPRAKQSEIFNPEQQTDQSKTAKHESMVKSISPKKKFVHGLAFLWNELKESYSSRSLIIWSAWWALASCGNLQVMNYVQNLWQVIAPKKAESTTYNGAVEAAGQLLGTIGTVGVGFIPVDWSVRGRAEIVMTSVCALNSVVLLLMAHTDDIWMAYVCYDIFRASYQVVITIATAQIARTLTRQRYGLVFGANMFLALVIETILTVIVVDDAVLGVEITVQFTVYGGYFAVMSLLFFLVAIFSCVTYGCPTRKQNNSYEMEADDNTSLGQANKVSVISDKL